MRSLARPRTIFGARLHALVAYGLDATQRRRRRYVRTLGAGRARHVRRSRARGAADGRMAASRARRAAAARTHEFERTLDVFPLEYGDIIADHVVIVGDDPFAGVRVADADRRAAASCRPRAT